MPHYDTEPWVDLPASPEQADYTGALTLWYDALFLLEYTFTLTWICFTQNVSSRTTIHGLTEYHIHHHSFLNSIASDQGDHFTANDVYQWLMLMGFTGLTISPHPKAVGLTEEWSCFVKIQL